MTTDTILVLVVEDDPLVGELYADLLREHGFQVRIARNATEGITAAKQSAVDVILMDIVMPEMTGLEALEVITQIAPETPVIMVTSHPTGEHAIGALKLGAYDFLPKGFQPNDLLSSIRRAAEKRRLMLENKRLIEGPQEKVRELTTLTEVGRTLNSSLNLDELLALVMQNAQEALRAEASSLMLIDEETSELFFSVALGERANALKPVRLKVSQGIGGWVAKTGRPLLVADVQSDHRFDPTLDELTGFHTRSMLCVPIHVKGKTIGIIEVINRTGGGRFKENDLTLLSAIAAQAAVVIQNAQLYRDAERKNIELSFLLQSSQDLLSVIDLDTIFSRMMEKLLEIIPAARAGVIILEDGEVGRVVAGSVDSRRLPPERSAGGNIRLAMYPEIREVMRSGRPLAISDVLADPLMLEVRDCLRAIGLRSLLITPLLEQDRVFGVMNVAQFERSRRFSADAIRLCQTLANQASIAVANARLYRELREKSDQLEQTSRYKSEFLANMSHELRTPLNSILGFSQLLQHPDVGPLTEKQLRYVTNILASGEHLHQLINEILDLAKVEVGKLAIKPEPLKVAATLKETVALVQGLAHQKAQTVQAKIEPDLPLLQADPVRFKQICFNLLSNAVKFTPDGGLITVSARRISGGSRDEVRPSAPGAPPAPPQHSGADALLEIQVRDSGIGIRPEDLPRLFQQFVQLDGSPSKRHEGTGLGLVLTRRLVELHGGRIWAESLGEGQGSTFTVHLPIAPPAGPPGASADISAS